MAILPFAPQRNSRHRIAVLALYRALLRAGSKVELPEDVTQSRRVHPVKHAIRKRFASNVALTSPRFLYASMAAGYRLWDTLCKAGETDSQEHHQVIEHFRKRIRRTTPEVATEKLSRNANKEPAEGTQGLVRQPRVARMSKSAKAAEREPLLTRISEPGEMPKYTYNFSRAENKSKKRLPKGPSLASTAEGYPFVRLVKPQPLPMSKAIGIQTRMWKNTILKVTEIEDIGNYEALAEDEWDHLVAGQMVREGIEPSEEEASAKATEIESTYVWTVQLARMWHEFKLERRLQAWAARGAALHALVTDQRTLVTQGKEKTQDQLVKNKNEDLTPNRVTPLPNVKVQNPFRLLHMALQGLPAGKLLEDYNGDPFGSPFWTTILNNSQKNLGRGTRHKVVKKWLEERKHLQEERDKLTGGEKSPLFSPWTNRDLPERYKGRALGLVSEDKRRASDDHVGDRW